MKKNIEILSLRQHPTKNGCDVTFGIKIGENNYDLTYKITGESITEVPERCDAVVLTFLFFAIRHGMDIKSKYPMSEKLYYRIKKHIMPAVCFANSAKASMINIDVPISDEEFEGTWNGTGVSLGVDSFATIHEYLEDDIPEEYRLTHLVNLKTGAHHGQIGHFDKKAEDKLFAIENARAKEYCDKMNIPLITIESNLFEICCGEFGWNFDTTHIVRNLGAILLLQDKFARYYYATTLPQTSIKIDMNHDQAYYEKWLIPLIATESTEFYSANGEMNRCQKVEYISRFEDTYDNIHVCWHETANCGKCSKCIRTLVQLDLIGALDNYKKSFDIEYYRKNRKKYIKTLLAQKGKDPYYYEIYLYMKNNNIKMPGALPVQLWKIKILWEKVVRRIKRILKNNGLSGEEQGT